MSAHKYELMFIADPELDERGLKKYRAVSGARHQGRWFRREHRYLGTSQARLRD